MQLGYSHAEYCELIKLAFQAYHEAIKLGYPEAYASLKMLFAEQCRLRLGPLHNYYLNSLKFAFQAFRAAAQSGIQDAKSTLENIVAENRADLLTIATTDEEVLALKKYGVDIHQGVDSQTGMSASLLEAIEAGNASKSELLLRNGARIHSGFLSKLLHKEINLVNNGASRWGIYLSVLGVLAKYAPDVSRTSNEVIQLIDKYQQQIQNNECSQQKQARKIEELRKMRNESYRSQKERERLYAEESKLCNESNILYNEINRAKRIVQLLCGYRNILAA